MNQEQINFINTLPLSPNQREFVADCWRRQPRKNKPPSRLVQVLDYALAYGISIALLLFLVVWPHQLIANIVIGVCWVEKLLLTTVLLMNAAMLKHACGFLPNTSPAIHNADNLLTNRQLLKKMVPSNIWVALQWMCLTAVSLTALTMSRCWSTAVMYAASSVVVLLFAWLAPLALKRFIVARASVYAKKNHLDPEVEPIAVNLYHPRPVR